MSIEAFFYLHPIFRYEEFLQWREQQGSCKPTAIKKALQYYVKTERLLNVRRGLYAVVPPSISPQEMLLDGYCVAGKATPDSVLGYHTALELHGIAYSVFNRFMFLTAQKSKPFEFQTHWFQSVMIPKALKTQSEIGVATIERQGVTLRVTTPERTFVDVIDRVSLSGGWEEVVRSINNMAVLNVDEVVHYCLLLDNRHLASKVGFFLEQRKGAFTVEPQQLQLLQARIPETPQCLTGTHHETCRLVKKWNLMVPDSVLNQSWEEPHGAV